MPGVLGRVRIIPARAGNACARTSATSISPDHPRASGERADAVATGQGGNGSSPRERGTLRPQFACLFLRRIIPARAGNAWAAASPCSPRSDHPRASGERRHAAITSESIDGSSPRERGTLKGAGPRKPRRRIIPARAGNARCLRARSCWSPDHPRASGERSSGGYRRISVSGSSPRERGTPRSDSRDRARLPDHPRASGERRPHLGGGGPVHGSSPRERGTHAASGPRRRRLRIIPARAGNASPVTPKTYSMPDHPRASGERTRPAVTSAIAVGSSPRERGTLFGVRVAVQIGRIIPARAGNAYAMERVVDGHADHPRASGERVHAKAAKVNIDGSSPRERGTHHTPETPTPPDRIIPARAGNARAGISTASVRADHPRASGERRPSALRSFSRSGSSPRERGTPGSVRRRRHLLRIIPARAGNAPRRGPPPTATPDHPRASGERNAGKILTLHGYGSSPRERGTPRRRKRGAALGRIIPARAGNASALQASNSVSADHPRASGERRYPCPSRAPCSGSSPRERGTRAELGRAGRRRRIIPARAGNALRARPRDPVRTDHPRASGERFRALRTPFWNCGSSPRERGTRLCLAGEAGIRRIIPARAGNATTRKS